MKKHYPLFTFSTICQLLVWLCCITIQTQAQSQTGLVQHYSFDGTLSNTAATHTITGGSNFTADRFSRATSAYYVQANTDIISSAGIPNLPTGAAARTVSFWFQTPGSGGTYHLFNYGAAGHGFYIFYNNSTGIMSVGDGVTNVFVAAIGTSTAWRHVAVTYEDALFVLYVNGVKSKQEYLTLNTAANPVSRIGKDAGTTLTSNFKIDDLYIYNRALPVEDVATLHAVKCLADPVATLVSDTICTGQTVRINFNRIVYLYATSVGGTTIALNDSYTTPALTTTTTYYMQVGTGSCVSNMVPVKVPVKAKAAAPTNASEHYEVNLCEYGNAILRVAPNASYSAKWYTSNTGGTAVATGTSYTTPLMASNKTYYAAHEGAGVCASDRIPVDVTILTRPVATLTASQTTICPGDTVSFSGFENADFSLHKNNIWVSGGYFYDGPHAYKDAPQQTSTYILSVGDWAMCRGTASVTVTVKAAPAVAIAASKSATCASENVTLTASGANGYVWSTGGTTAGTIQSPSVTTTYTVKGTSTATGCSKTVSTTITVTPLPTVVVTPASATSCAGQPTTLTASGATTYSWSTAATTASITPAPTATTTYTVTGTSNGCSKAAYATVTVKALPVVTVSPTSASICAGESTTLTASGATTYSWSTAATTASITLVPTATTTYTVTGTSNGCSKTAAATVTVKALPAVAVTPASASICAGEPTTLTASGATTYSWSTAATTASIAPAPTATTTYTVTGTSNGCSKTATATVTVKALPTVAVTPASASICAGEPTTLTASGATTYSWSTAATTAIITPTPAATTTYTVTGTSNGCSKTASAIVTVNALPTPGIQQNGTTLKTEMYDLYQWYKEGSLIQNATAQGYETEGAGNFTVFVTNDAGCSAMSAPVTIITTSTVDYLKSTSIHVYPNPASSLLHIDLPQDTQVRIFNMAGLQVDSFKISSEQTSITVDHLHEGCYLLNTDTGGSVKFCVK
jgi:hypothetical protein